MSEEVEQSEKESKVIDEKGDLLEIQNNAIERAKENLTNDGYVSPIAILPSVSDGKGQFQGVPAGEKTLALNPLGDLMGGSPEIMLYRLVQLTHEDPEEGRLLIDLMMQTAPEEVEHPEELVLHMLLNHLQLHEKDIVPLHIRDLIEEFNAYAVITVHESWAKTDVKNVEQQGSLADDPEASECILVSLETKGWQRVVQVPFVRVGEGEDETFEFQEPKVLDSEEEGVSIQGRFFGYFDEQSGKGGEKVNAVS